MTRAALLALGAACLVGCAGAQHVPCAAPIAAQYTAEMIAAGCTGAHFNDLQCTPIKAERDAREKAVGCK